MFDYETLASGDLRIFFREDGEVGKRRTTVGEAIEALPATGELALWSALLQDLGMTGNGWGQVDPNDIGALTSDPFIITDDYTVEDDGTVEVGGRLWHYPDYAIRSPLTDLREKGETVLTLVPRDSDEDATEEKERQARFDAAEPRIKALAKHLDCDVDELDEGYRENAFEQGSREYLVFTDAEADEACKDYIREHLWTFNIEFIATHFKVDLSDDAREAMREMAGKLCESANPIFEALVDDFDALVSDAIGCDGRGHFLGQYDGDEHEVEVDGTTYYIYRQ